MRILLHFLIVATGALLAATAPHAAQWARTYRSGGDSYAGSVRPTPDGGYVVTGRASYNAWVWKLDATFNLVWQRAFEQNMENYAVDVQPTSDGGYLVVGTDRKLLTPGATATSAWVLKFDGGGHVAWQKVSDIDEAYVAISTAQPVDDGGFMVAGWRRTPSGTGSREVMLARLDAVGNFVSVKTYGVMTFSVGHVVPANDGGHVVLGYDTSFGGLTWVLKVDATGIPLWQKTYRGCVGSTLQPGRDGGYVLAGTVYSGVDGKDACVLKVDELGDPVWQKVFGGADPDGANSVLPIADGGYVVAGYTESFGAGRGDAWLLRLDASGNIVWQRTYGSPGVDRAMSVQATADGGYLVAGSTASVTASDWKAWLLKVDANGAIGECALMGTSNAAALDGSIVASATTTTATVRAPTSGSWTPLRTYVTDAMPIEQCYDPAPASRLTAVEYYYRTFDHYFLTTLPQEMAALDGGAFPGWARTGKSFEVYGLDPAAARVCRFWSGQTFAPKSSHFYTPYSSECAYLKQQGVWQYESDLFGLGLPAGPPGQGTCGTATKPLYRAYNNGMSGAPNHRYTTDPVVLDEMIRHGWVMEGEASTRVFACVPAQH